jgi:transcriptional regulator with XRE-family HTH domain
MVSEKERSSVVRRQLGRRLRRFRFEARKTIEDVVFAGVASRSKIWRIEAGQGSVKVGDVLALSRFYRVEAGMTDELIRLAEASKGSGYLEDYKGTEWESIGLYAELEANACAVSDYQPELVHGLLQTEAYARAVVEVAPGVTDSIIDQRVDFRLRRQQVFFERETAARIDAVVTAGALSVQVGSASVMEEQREHLRALAGRDGVSIRVLPFENGLHSAPYGPFTMLDFDDPEDPSLVYVESLVGGRYIEVEDHVARFRAAFEQVRARGVPVEEYCDERHDPVGEGIGQRSGR